MATRPLRAAFAASFLVGALLGAGACNEKKGAESAADANASASASASATPPASASGSASADAPADASVADTTDAGSAGEAGASAAAATDAGARHGGDAGSASLETAGHGDGGGGARAALSLDESAAGKTVELAAGQSMTLSLGANATTGFDWSVTKAPAALGTPEMTYVQGGTQMGAPGTRKLTWTLKSALPAGEHAVELAYARSFEKGVAPFKTFKLKVRAAR